MFKKLLLTALLFGLIAHPARAALNTNGPGFAQSFVTLGTQIVNGSTTTAQTLATGTGNGCAVEALICSSSDTSSRDIEVVHVIGSTSFEMGTTTVPATSGTVALVPSVYMMNNMSNLAQDQNGNPFIRLGSGDTLTVQSLVTVTSGKHISCNAHMYCY